MSHAEGAHRPCASKHSTFMQPLERHHATFPSVHRGRRALLLNGRLRSTTASDCDCLMPSWVPRAPPQSDTPTQWTASSRSDKMPRGYVQACLGNCRFEGFHLSTPAICNNQAISPEVLHLLETEGPFERPREPTATTGQPPPATAAEQGLLVPSAKHEMDPRAAAPHSCQYVSGACKCL